MAIENFFTFDNIAFYCLSLLFHIRGNELIMKRRAVVCERNRNGGNTAGEFNFDRIR